MKSLGIWVLLASMQTVKANPYNKPYVNPIIITIFKLPGITLTVIIINKVITCTLHFD